MIAQSCFRAGLQPKHIRQEPLRINGLKNEDIKLGVIGVMIYFSDFIRS